MFGLPTVHQAHIASTALPSARRSSTSSTRANICMRRSTRCTAMGRTRRSSATPRSATRCEMKTAASTRSSARSSTLPASTPDMLWRPPDTAAVNRSSVFDGMRRRGTRCRCQHSGVCGSRARPSFWRSPLYRDVRRRRRHGQGQRRSYRRQRPCTRRGCFAVASSIATAVRLPRRSPCAGPCRSGHVLGHVVERPLSSTTTGPRGPSTRRSRRDRCGRIARRTSGLATARSSTSTVQAGRRLTSEVDPGFRTRGQGATGSLLQHAEEQDT